MRYCASDASCGKYSLFKLVPPVFLAEGSKQRYNKAGFNALIHGREIRIPTECHDDKRRQHMKVLGKQRNSRMCVICGMDNPFGIKAQFYNMEDGSVLTPFRFREEHQSYPQRVHGGMIAAMLDELGLRAAWHGGEDIWGVTMSLEVKYRKPVPYDADLFGRGVVEKDFSRFLLVKSEILNAAGEVLADAHVKYIKLAISQIAQNSSVHEEMCYLLEDNVRELCFAADGHV